jgi:hypothetical protein
MRDCAATVIVSLHVATGGLVGALTGSRLRALALGPVAHVVGDVVPHEDIESKRFEIWSGVVALAWLAARRGPLHPITLGAAAAAAPDLEHVLHLPRPGGKPLCPSHRWPDALHRGGGIPAWGQLLVAAALLGVLGYPTRRE